MTRNALFPDLASGLGLRVAACALVAAFAARPDRAHSAEVESPDYRPYTRSYRLPYGNSQPLDFDRLGSMSVRVSINGGPGNPDGVSPLIAISGAGRHFLPGCRPVRRAQTPLKTRIFTTARASHFQVSEA